MIRRLLMTLALAGSLLVVGPLAGPAAADDCALGGTSGCETVDTVAQGTGYYTIGGTSCGAWVSSSGWGGACASPGSYYGDYPEPPTWQEIIDSAPGRTFDPCRVDKLAPGFSQPPPPAGEEERAQGDEWLIRICMEGYDLGSTDGGDATELVMERVWDRYEPEPGWMDYIWGDVAANQSSFPYAMVDYGPNAYPVVNSPIFFYIDFQRFTADDGPVSMGSRPRIEVPLGTDMGSGETIYLVATATGVGIDTGDGGLARCLDAEDRRNRFEVGEDTIEEFAETTQCKWTYKHSSASEEDEAYDVVAKARWTVRYRIGEEGPLELLNRAEPTVVQTRMSYQIPVQEVQVRDCVVDALCTQN